MMHKFLNTFNRFKSICLCYEMFFFLDFSDLLAKLSAQLSKINVCITIFVLNHILSFILDEHEYLLFLELATLLLFQDRIKRKVVFQPNE